MKEMPITFNNYTDANESVQANRIGVALPAGTPDDHPCFVELRRLGTLHPPRYVVMHHLLCRYFPEVALDRHEAMMSSGIANVAHHTRICMDIIAGKYNHPLDKDALQTFVFAEFEGPIF